MRDHPNTPTRPSPFARGRADAVVGLLVVGLELVVCVIAAIRTALPDGDGSGGHPAGRAGPAPPSVPAADWTATVTFGVIAAAAVVLAVLMFRFHRPWTGATQVLAALTLCLVTVSAGGGRPARDAPVPREHARMVLTALPQRWRQRRVREERGLTPAGRAGAGGQT